MCYFFSLVLTENNIFYDIANHSHSHIIEKYKLVDSCDELVKIEVTPHDYNTMAGWQVKVDQDQTPRWFDRELEEKHVLKVVKAAIKDISVEELQLAAVKQKGHAIQHITNPSEKVQLAAVKQDGYSLRYITNPSEELQLVAVEQNGHVIPFIINPSEKVKALHNTLWN